MPSLRLWPSLWLALLVASCGGGKPVPVVPSAATPVADGGAPTPCAPPDDAGLPADAGAAAPADAADARCPAGMAYVETTFCPKIERKCLFEEYSRENHITLCHEFAPEQRCLVPEETRRFCIDRYEWPNREGAHPAWMASWYDAQATCGSEGKRLCWDSEWVAACEGPDHTPFPYGRARDHDACNVDNLWIDPRLDDLYSSDTAIADRELGRLDQSVASGAMPRCVSGFGVHDLTGNLDEWVTSEHPPEDKSAWAGLKGGAWGHVRNACRPMTTSHPPDFKYYFISFRCCADAPGGETFTPKGNQKAPPIDAGVRATEPHPDNAPGPSKKKVQRERRSPPRRKRG